MRKSSRGPQSVSPAEQYLASVGPNQWETQHERVLIAIHAVALEGARAYVRARPNYGIDDKSTVAMEIADDVALAVAAKCPDLLRKPGSVPAYIRKCVYDLMVDRYRHDRRAKRGGGKVLQISQVSESDVNKAMSAVEGVAWDVSDRTERDDLIDPEQRMLDIANAAEGRKRMAGYRRAFAQALESLTPEERAVLASTSAALALERGCSRRSAQLDKRRVALKVRELANEFLRKVR